MTSTSCRPRVSGDPVSQRPELGDRRLDCGRWGYWMPAFAGMTAEELMARPAFLHEVIA